MPSKPKTSPAASKPKPAATQPADVEPSLGSILFDALDDPDVFGKVFLKDSWKAWRSFLAALFAVPMDDEELAIYKKCTGRTAPPAKPFDTAALVVGRRGGKSRVLALVAVFLATFRDYRPYLDGDKARIVVLAVDKAQARQIADYAAKFLKEIPLFAAYEPKMKGDLITLNNEVEITVSAASFRSIRGRTYAAVLCDEIAYWMTEDGGSSNPDTEIIRAVEPGMLTIPGAILLLASSPYAKRGVLWESYRKNFGKDEARTLVWQADTLTMHPTVNKEKIEQAYEEDPEAAAAEFGGQFRSDIADYVSRETILAVTCDGRSELPPEPGITYAAFCDPSGGSSDSMTLAVGHLSQDNVAVLDTLLEVRAPFNPDDAVEQCATVLKRYGISRVIGDKYAGSWPVAGFASHGIAFDQCADPKSTIYANFLPLLNSKRVELLDIPRLASQLFGLERRTARGGKDSIDHRPGAKDDVVNSAAGCLVSLDADRRPALVTTQDVLSNGVAAPLPAHVAAFFSVILVAKDGTAAVLYCALAVPTLGTVRLFIADFHVGPLRRSIFGDVVTRLGELMGETQVMNRRLMVFTTEIVRNQASQAGFDFTLIPDRIAKSENLMISSAGHISAGEVKVTWEAYDKASTSPLGAALTFRGGDKPDDPLRAAVLTATALALDT